MTTHIQYLDRDFLLSANEPDEYEELRQEIAELTSEVSLKRAELEAIKASLAGDLTQPQETASHSGAESSSCG